MIQTILPLYKSAIRTSLVAKHKITDEFITLFSVIELQTEDEYPYNIPSQEWKDGKYVRDTTDKYEFYLSIDKLDVSKAIAEFNTPHNFLILNKKVVPNDIIYVKEPTGNYPLCYAPNCINGASSVLPKRDSGLLVWCQIDSNRIIENKFFETNSRITKEMKAIQSLTSKWLGFDILENREHIGNIYLSAPNPYFRKIDINLSSNPCGIFYKIYTRGDFFEPLFFRIIDTHGDTIAFDKVFKIEKATDIIKLPHEPSLFELRVFNKNNDLIALHETSVFIKNIQCKMAVKQADLVVRNGVGELLPPIEKFSDASTFNIATDSNSNEELYFKNIDDENEYIKLEGNHDFIFFDGDKNDKREQKEDAKRFVRNIIAKAADRCYICDPYFKASDIIAYAFHTKSTKAKVRVLNSKAYISQDDAQYIKETVSQFNSKDIGTIEVRILKGDTSILHDRFIIVDNNVWFVGTSFNEIGGRATCIGRVPKGYAKKIIRKVEDWFFSDEYSEGINKYIEAKDE